MIINARRRKAGARNPVRTAWPQHQIVVIRRAMTQECQCGRPPAPQCSEWPGVTFRTCHRAARPDRGWLQSFHQTANRCGAAESAEVSRIDRAAWTSDSSDCDRATAAFRLCARRSANLRPAQWRPVWLRVRLFHARPARRTFERPGRDQTIAVEHDSPPKTRSTPIPPTARPNETPAGPLRADTATNVKKRHSVVRPSKGIRAGVSWNRQLG